MILNRCCSLVTDFAISQVLRYTLNGRIQGYKENLRGARTIHDDKVGVIDYLLGSSHQYAQSHETIFEKTRYTVLHIKSVCTAQITLKVTYLPTEN